MKFTPVKKKKVFCPPAIQLVDESITLFFRLPTGALATYYLSTIPICIGLILFWHDMRTGLNASSRTYPEALVLAVLYCFMKLGHAAFSSQIYHRLASLEDAPWTLARMLHVALIQTIIGGSFFIIYPISFVIGIPFPWVNSFYHNVSFTGSEAKSTLSSTFNDSIQMAILWPSKNAFGFIYQFILGFVVMVNLLIIGIGIPLLLKYFLNIETSFAQSPDAFRQSSAPLLTIIICYLILNPINKTYHVLRCFYGKSRSSGVDLLAALRIRKSLFLSMILICCMSVGASPSWSQSTDSSASNTSTPSATPNSNGQPQDTSGKTPNTDVQLSPSAQKLDQSINKTLGQGDYKWRTANSDEDPILKSISTFFQFYRSVTDSIQNFFKNALEHGNTNPENTNAGLPVVEVTMRLVLLVAAILLVVAIVYAITRWRSSMAAPAALPALPIRKVDLNEENITADALPEDSWLVLARELIARGEFRLALRAFYLASLATMASREWVMLSRGKSNRDYLREFGRRLRTQGAPVAYFSQTMDLFEASWYGDHSVTDSTLSQVEKNHQLLKQHAS